MFFFNKPTALQTETVTLSSAKAWTCLDRVCPCSKNLTGFLHCVGFLTQQLTRLSPSLSPNLGTKPALQFLVRLSWNPQTRKLLFRLGEKQKRAVRCDEREKTKLPETLWTIFVTFWILKFLQIRIFEMSMGHNGSRWRGWRARRAIWSSETCFS